MVNEIFRYRFQLTAFTGSSIDSLDSMVDQLVIRFFFGSIVINRIPQFGADF